MDELERRLRGRQTESESMITKRLEAARREIEQWGSFDYFLESSSREQDLQRLQAITYAESMRTSGVGSPNALLH
jgi:guanylate kinase